MTEITTGVTFYKMITLETEICCNCGIAFGLPSDFRSRLLNDPNNYFYCPNGHSQHYSESRETKLRKQAEADLRKMQEELDRANNKWVDEMQAKIKADAERRKAERKLKRLNNGVCSCCNRSFTNLADHIKTQHPELIGKEKPKRIYKTKKS